MRSAQHHALTVLDLAKEHGYAASAALAPLMKWFLWIGPPISCETAWNNYSRLAISQSCFISDLMSCSKKPNSGVSACILNAGKTALILPFGRRFIQMYCSVYMKLYLKI